MSFLQLQRSITFDKEKRHPVNKLLLYVDRDDNIRNIQKKFTEIFPHLWISIFRHSDGEPPKQDVFFTRETQIADINPVFSAGKLEIDPHMTVTAFESDFYDQFGLFVQVSKRNGLADTRKFGFDHFALDEVDQEVKEKISEKAETILFRDVPFGC
jgi:hypothetical protein